MTQPADLAKGWPVFVSSCNAATASLIPSESPAANHTGNDSGAAKKLKGWELKG